MISIVFIGHITGISLYYIVKQNDQSEIALSERTWKSVEKTINLKINEGYEHVGKCTGFVYWCLRNAYGVDWGSNSYVMELDKKLREAEISVVEKGSDGEITDEMKPGDIIIFKKGSVGSHCAILGEDGYMYHATFGGVTKDDTLSEWMQLPIHARNCDRYTIYRGLK